ncbi:unnamed protein product [Ambrosiozyma monospora]|uniref:Unnamed protein product n=1 Tax=Ambrosiozyma monospora TaxID=43982 RepID=A0ACB5SZG2_AMBMO|nr:unnamed protein product [Ambrosiozyma monospora]
MSTEQFHAIGIESYENWQEPKAFTYTPQPQRPQDVDIEIEACGICGSDLHAIKGDWGTPYLPLAVGHEIIGKVVKVGSEVTKFKPGDRVGIGGLCDSCGECRRCTHGNSNNCRKCVPTYHGTYPETGLHTQGGYADYIRVSEKFTFKIPDNLSSEIAAPLMCGGMTGFRPLLTAGVKKGTRVGVVGIGGIGHMTILFAKAMGAEVTAISRSDSKKEIALKLGVDHYISTSEEGFAEKYADSLDVIVNTGSSFSENSIMSVSSLLDAFGQFIFITAPPMNENIELAPFFLLANNYSVAGSALGSPADTEYMLQFAADHQIKPWVETIDINEESVKTAWNRLDKGDVKFRFVLTGYDKYFKKN